MHTFSQLVLLANNLHFVKEKMTFGEPMLTGQGYTARTDLVMKFIRNFTHSPVTKVAFHSHLSQAGVQLKCLQPLALFLFFSLLLRSQQLLSILITP